MPRLSAYFELLRWLGPWSDPSAAPKDVAREEMDAPSGEGGDRPFKLWVYSRPDRPPEGALLLCPGLHFAGPADPRMDRFARILARAGILVVAPFLPDFAELRVAEGLVRDLDRSLEALLRHPSLPPGIRPGIFSISFGSLPTLRLAAMPHRAAEIGALVIFGGYAEWDTTIRFCLTGDAGDGVAHPHDPLNRPVVLMNLFESLPSRPDDPAPLFAAWRRYVESTWGRPEMKARARFSAVAEALLPSLPADAVPLFRLGIGLDEGAFELCTAALEATNDRTRFLDPRPHLQGLRCPIHICHGYEDDVIPYTQVKALAQAMPPHVQVKTYLTGMFGHTGTTGLARWLGALPLLGRELYTMLAMMRAIVSSATRR